MTEAHYNPDPHAHPGLHVIAVVEAIKGVLAIIAATGLALIGPDSLQHWVEALIDRFQFNPEHGAFAWLLHAINPGSVHLAAAAVLAYGLLHLVEAWGLWGAKAWASVLGCLAAGIYLPFEFRALFGHPGWLSVTVLSVNLVVVGVLARDLVKRRS